jgi:hypothetical protein
MLTAATPWVVMSSDAASTMRSRVAWPRLVRSSPAASVLLMGQMVPRWVT